MRKNIRRKNKRKEGRERFVQQMRDSASFFLYPGMKAGKGAVKMKYIIDGRTMKAADAYTIGTIGIPVSCPDGTGGSESGRGSRKGEA